MSKLVSRILLTILLFPSAALLLFVLFIFLEPQMRDETAIVIATMATCGYIIAYWVALWWKSVVWTPGRVQTTVGCAAGAAGVGVTLGLMIAATFPYGADELAFFTGSLVATVLWIIGTICIWRENQSERAARLRRAGADTIVCPACGYNLTGLREARCPECGAQYTLNELLAGQTSREAAEIEQS